jgi:hypothetical protein
MIRNDTPFVDEDADAVDQLGGGVFGATDPGQLSSISGGVLGVAAAADVGEWGVYGVSTPIIINAPMQWGQKMIGASDIPKDLKLRADS